MTIYDNGLIPFNEAANYIYAQIPDGRSKNEENHLFPWSICLKHTNEIDIVDDQGNKISCTPDERTKYFFWTKDLDNLREVHWERKYWLQEIEEEITKAREIKRKAERLQISRFTAIEATMLIAEGRTNPKSILDKLEKAARAGQIPTYYHTHPERSTNSNSQFYYPPLHMSSGSYCFTGYDLNTWLKQTEPELFKHFQFPQPSEKPAENSLKFELLIKIENDTNCLPVASVDTPKKIDNQNFLSENPPVPESVPHPANSHEKQSDENQTDQANNQEQHQSTSAQITTNLKDPNQEEWKIKGRELADEIGLMQYKSGIQQITARSICKAVAEKLAKGTPENPGKYWGTQGPRNDQSVRNRALNGWKFTPPTGTNGTK